MFGCVLDVRRPVFRHMNDTEASKDQWLIQVKGWFHTNVLNSVFPLIAELVEPEAVLFRLDQIDKLLLQMNVLFIVYGAFEDRILHSLPKVQTPLCNVSEPSLSSFVASSNIVGY